MSDNAPAATAAKSEPNGTKDGHNNNLSRQPDARGQRGGRFQGGRGRGGQREGQARGSAKGFGSNNRGGRHKKADMGRGEWNRNNVDKRKRNNEERDGKRQRIDEPNPYAVTQFSKEEIDAEGRKPKKKVAVMIGYAGSGYKGMQINAEEKTIEGDIFKAFVAAGAISKANADDPKKSSLVRCARTDKGVHAAGNVISLKLIVEDPDIIKKINENLPPQIRVWGLERTNGSFSCYQSCDSRWYEYLIPTYSFIPPHPKSFLGKKLLESAEKMGVLEEWKSRQEDAADFWEKAEETYVKPILDTLDLDMQEAVMAAIHSSEEEPTEKRSKAEGSKSNGLRTKESDYMERTSDEVEPKIDTVIGSTQSTEETQMGKVNTGSLNPLKRSWEELENETEEETTKKIRTEIVDADETKNVEANIEDSEKLIARGHVIYKVEASTREIVQSKELEVSKSILSPLEVAIKQVKAAYITAKKSYQISDIRKQKVQEALNCYIGTKNFHNYTIQKLFSDPSAKRVIRSFKVGPAPIYINDTEWLSLKVHGQSFMMHQIRKMIAMASLAVRCGTSLDIIEKSYTSATISIPKAPGLGLLLERPVFDNYNKDAVTKFQKEKIDFDKYKEEMDEFKQREIYDRIFREEEKDHQFHTFFHHIDHYRTDFFLWVTAEGISAARQSKARNEFLEDEDDGDDKPDANGQEG